MSFYWELERVKRAMYMLPKEVIIRYYIEVLKRFQERLEACLKGHPSCYERVIELRAIVTELKDITELKIYELEDGKLKLKRR